MEVDELREQLDDIPHEPGVYQFFEGDTALYFGKGVDLRNRVTSYLDPRSPRIEAMLRRADRLEVAITDTETQALLLEANLIKRHQPRYNVRLTDDKSFPLIQLTDHEYPRIEVTRDPEPNATVYGPYTDRQRLDEVVKALRERYGLRGCSDHKFDTRDRPCLDHEIGICAAPCTGEIGHTDYSGGVQAAKRFFEGEIGILAGPIESAMEEAATNHEYERAANLRDRLEAAQRLHGQFESAVSAPTGPHTLDVLGVAIKGDQATIARLHSEGGQLVERSRRVMTAPSVSDERVVDVLDAFIAQYYAERYLPDVILVQELPRDRELRAWLEQEGVDLRVPGAGREATLLDLALKNAHHAPVPEGDPVDILGERLGIDPPRRIEGIDVSHAQGRAVVGSNVVFVDGTPAKEHYRRKKLPEGNDDVDRIRQLASWRVQRSIQGRDDRPDPDLLLVDGGESQFDAVSRIVQGFDWPVTVVALAKREETVIIDGEPNHWPGDDPTLHLLQRVRDEAHRFAVSYHQTLRDSIETVLDDIPGIGPAKRRRLLRRFGSLDGIRSASRTELLEVDGIGDETADELMARL